MIQLNPDLDRRIAIFIPLFLTEDIFCHSHLNLEPRQRQSAIFAPCCCM